MLYTLYVGPYLKNIFTRPQKRPSAFSPQAAFATS